MQFCIHDQMIKQPTGKHGSLDTIGAEILQQYANTPRNGYEKYVSQHQNSRVK